jgi:ABC-type branched-subunit amino acid transport system substrate-binding protein
MISTKRVRLVLCVATSLTAIAVLAGTSGATGRSTGVVTVERGQPVQLAFTAVTQELPVLADFSKSFENAITMAIEQHPTIHGHPIAVNTIETSCSGDNSSSAASIVANQQNTAVLGNICSEGFVSAVPIYESAGIATISGSATVDNLPPLGSHVFNRTVVSEGDGFDAWYTKVLSLPSDIAWQEAYLSRFGAPPMPYADLYFDATSLLIHDLQRVSRISHGTLVINRAKLARAIRDTTHFHGVSCRITLDRATGNRLNDPSALARCAAD